MQASAARRVDRASFGARLIAHGSDVVVRAGPNLGLVHTLGRICRDVVLHFSHHLDHDGVECAVLDSSAKRLEFPGATPVYKRFSHLAARTSMDADEEDGFHVPRLAKRGRLLPAASKGWQRSVSAIAACA